MSIVFLKNILFGSPKRPAPENTPRTGQSQNGYGAANTISPRPKPSDPQGDFQCLAKNCHGKSEIARSSGSISACLAPPNTDVDIEAQETEPLINQRPVIERSATARAFEEDSGSTLSQSQRVDARIISDAIIGLSDGLTVPFALTAGLSTLGDVKVVIFGGLAELTAGAISMGLGGYLGAQSELEAYQVTYTGTQDLVNTCPEQTTSVISTVFAPYHLPPETVNSIATSLQQSPQQLLCFIMQFYHNLPPPAANRALTSAITIALGYFLGGFVPLLPYFLVKKTEVMLAFYWSVATMAIALFAFGYVKTCIVSGWEGKKHVLSGLRGGLQMVLVGGFAAGAAMGLVKAFE